MTLILDAGAFIGLERGSVRVAALLKREQLAGREPRTHAGVVGQVWRGGASQQTPASRALEGTEIVPLDDFLGRRTGLLLALAGTSDVIDAALVLLAENGDVVLTSDPDDLAELAIAAGADLEIIPT